MDVGTQTADRLRPKGLTDGQQESQCSDSKLQTLRNERYKVRNHDLDGCASRIRFELDQNGEERLGGSSSLHLMAVPRYCG